MCLTFESRVAGVFFAPTGDIPAHFRSLANMQKDKRRLRNRGLSMPSNRESIRSTHHLILQSYCYAKQVLC